MTQENFSQLHMPRLERHKTSSNTKLIVCMCLVTQSYPTPYDSRDCSLPGSSVQASILECAVMPSFRASSQPKDQTQVSRIAGGFFTFRATTL